MATHAIALSLAKKVRSLLETGSSKVCSDKESWKNKYSYDMLKLADRVYILAWPIYHGGR